MHDNVINYIMYFVKQSLEEVSSERFLQFPVEEDSELLTFIESQIHPRHKERLTFHRGNAFYQFSRESEDISGKKEVVLMAAVR